MRGAPGWTSYGVYPVSRSLRARPKICAIGLSSGPPHKLAGTPVRGPPAAHGIRWSAQSAPEAAHRLTATYRRYHGAGSKHDAKERDDSVRRLVLAAGVVALIGLLITLRFGG